jgi:hypothetical protein
LGLVHLVLSLLLGTSLLRLMPIRFYWPEFAAGACVVGLLVGGVVNLTGICLLGYPMGSVTALAILAVGSAAALAYRRPEGLFLTPLLTTVQRVVWLVLTLLSGGIFVELFFTHMLWNRGGVYYTGGATWGDLALHLSLITRFATQDRFTWDFPIFHDARLAYPFLIDFISSILLRHGFSLQWSLLVPGLLFSIAFVQLLFFLVFRWFRSSLAASLAVVVFLADGSPAGLSYFWRDWKASGQPLFEFLLHMTKEYAHLGEFNLRFSNVIADYFLPQRSILVGLPVFVLITLLLWHAWGRTPERKRLLLGAAILLGLLPFAHAHTYLVVVGVWGWLALVKAVQERRLANAWVGFLLLGIAFSAPQFIWQLGAHYGPGFSRWYFGWMKTPSENVLVFWLRNMGPGLVLLFGNILLVWRLRREPDFYLHFYLPLVWLFVIANLYLFQPHSYDNMKFMLYSYLGLSMFSGYWLARWFRGSVTRAALATVLLLSMTLCGAISILRETYAFLPFSSAEDIEVAERLKAAVPAEARVLTSDQHNHFVPTLTGRRIVMGYRGWLWTYGINYSGTERDVGSMYAGDGDAALLRRYGVAFVVIGPSERSSFNANQGYFDSHFPVALRSPSYTVYDVREVSTQPGRSE